MHVQDGLAQGIHVELEPAFAVGLADLVHLLHVHVGSGCQLGPCLIDALGRAADQGIPLAGPWRKERFAANDALTLSSRSAAMPALLNEARGRETRNFDDSAWPVMTLPAVEDVLLA